MLEFGVVKVRVEFEAQGQLFFPPGKQTNMLRGAFGLALKQASCEIGCPGAKLCPLASSCIYSRFFEPRCDAGPSGFREAPRPFVLRSASPEHLVPLAGRFRLDVILFDFVAPPLVLLERAFERMAAEGLGPSRVPAKLVAFEVEPVDRLPVAGQNRCGKMRVRFLTPVELKAGGDVCTEPDFFVLSQRLIERVWALGRFYQRWPDDLDWSELIELGRAVHLLAWKWKFEDVVRRSSRTGRRHSIGGFTGWAEYEGPLGSFLPLFKIAEWTGVGRQTVWGKGQLRIEDLTLDAGMN